MLRLEVGCAFVLLALILGACKVDKGPESFSAKTEAMTFSRIFVTQLLKSPGSAQFNPSLGLDDVKHLGNWKYQISSWVDSQNDFGALKRMTYTITLQHYGDGSWHVEDFQHSET